MRFLFIVALFSCGCSGLKEMSDSRSITDAVEEVKEVVRWETLFDGSSTEHWRGYRKEGFPAKGWLVEDGALHVVAGGGGGDIVTVDQYDDFDFSLEWKVNEPNANSGIIYRVSEVKNASYETGPEMQVFGDPEPTSSSTSAGGLYALYDTENKELKPIGQWNRARVVVCGNRVQHWLNGTMIVECELHSPDWYERVGKSKFGAMPLFGTVGRGHIALQEHGNDVWYRNIKIRPLSLRLAEGGVPIPLFNGVNLNGWTHFLKDGGLVEDTWSVENGVIICTGKPAGYIRTVDDYKNFVLELDWRWPSEPGNSGVLLRTVGEDKVWPTCIEGQLKADHAGDFWNLGLEMKADPDRTSGRNTRHTMQNENPPGEWNHYRILVNRGKIELEVNGKIINEAWECSEVAGKICLQSEGVPIHFRNIILTPLGDQ